MKDYIVPNPVAWGSGTSAAAYGTGSAGTTFGSGNVNDRIVFRTIALTAATIRELVVNILVKTESTTDVVFTASVYPTPGNTASARTVGTLTIPGATGGKDVAGDVWQRFSGLTNADVNPGEEVVIALTAKGSAATTANGFVSAILEPVTVGKVAEKDLKRAKPFGSNAAGTINTVVA